jgi:hypothetical protein
MRVGSGFRHKRLDVSGDDMAQPRRLPFARSTTEARVADAVRETGSLHILVFARLPVPGRVKSRLAAGVGPEAACSFYAACASHTLRTVDSCAAASHGRISWSLHYSDAADADGVRSWAQGLQLAACHRQVAQLGGSLGDRLYSAFEWAFEQPEGWAAVGVVGTDTPDLDGADLVGASCSSQLLAFSTTTDTVATAQLLAPRCSPATRSWAPQWTGGSTSWACVAG